MKKKQKYGFNILIWTFVIFFTVAWIGIKIEQTYFPVKVNLKDPKFPFGV